MKKILILTLSVMLFSASTYAEKKGTKTDDFVVAMDCQSCANKIKDALAFEKGIKELKFDIENNLLTVSYDSKKCNADKIVKALDKIDYKAELVEKNIDLDKQPAACKKCPHSGCGSAEKGCSGQ